MSASSGRRLSRSYATICSHADCQIAGPLGIAFVGCNNKRARCCLRHGPVWIGIFLYFGKRKVGDVADLFAPDIPLFDKPESGRKPVYFSKGPDVDIKSEARIERVLPVTCLLRNTRIYDGSVRSGIDEFRVKGPKAKLRGYVPRANPQDIPSLWKFRHMTGLC